MDQLQDHDQDQHDDNKLTVSAQIFQNDLVLDNIFKYLPLADLLQIRLVSSKCYENSRKFLNKMKNQLKAVKLLDIVWSSKERFEFIFNFKDFNETFASMPFEDILITKFKIPGVCFSEGFLESYEGSHAMEFFLKFSPQIMKKLIIEMDDKHDESYDEPKFFDRNIILQKSNILWPKLTSLEFVWGSFKNIHFLVEVRDKRPPESETGQYKYVKYDENKWISNTPNSRLEYSYHKSLKMFEKTSWIFDIPTSNAPPQLDDLKSLKIFENDSWNRNSRWDTALFVDLFKISPKLSKISFPDFIRENENARYDNNRSIYSGYYEILTIPEGQICNLTKLKFTHVTDNFLYILINLTQNNGMKLKSLIVHSEHSKYHTFDFLIELLCLHKDWIEEIDIRKSKFPEYYDDEEYIPWTLDFEMPKLQKLTISSETGHIRVKYNQLSQLFPQLKTLQIYQDSDNNRTHRFLWDDLNPLENNPQIGITELAILSPISWKNCLLKLPKSFPNVTKLTLRLGHKKLLEFLPLVWTLWPEKLEKLTLIFDPILQNNIKKISLFQKAFFGVENSSSFKQLTALNELILYRDLCLGGKKNADIFSGMKKLRKLVFIDEFSDRRKSIGNRRFSIGCQQKLKENGKIVKFLSQNDEYVRKLFLPEKGYCDEDYDSESDW